MQSRQANAWAALADPVRRAILERIARRPLAVGEIARKLPISRPAVSQHLKVLKDAGLVTDRPVGARARTRQQEGGRDIRAATDHSRGAVERAFRSVQRPGVSARATCSRLEGLGSVN